MTSTLRAPLFCAALLTLAGCATSSPEEHADDVVPVSLSGEELAAALDADGTTPEFESDAPFVRLGVIWDLADGPTPLARMRADASAPWSEWAELTVVFEEEESHAGHLDAPEGLATHYQVRFPGGTPLHLGLSPILEVPDLSAEPEVVGYDPDEDDEDLTGAPEGDVGAATEELRMGSFRVRSRRSWGARAPRCRDRQPPSTRATIHHTVTPTRDSISPERRLRLIQAFHMNSNGWCDIGYNYLVSRDGRVWRGRGGNYLGAHASNANYMNVGIAFMGDHRTARATRHQLGQAARLIVRLRQRGYPISLNRRDIKGHREHGGTTCPGDALYGQLGTIIRYARGMRR